MKKARSKEIKYTEENINSLLINNAKIKYETYINSKSYAIFIDPVYGEWKARVDNCVRYHGMHPQRKALGIKNRMCMKIDEVKTRIPNFVKIDETTFVDLKTPARFIDDKYGEFWKKPQYMIDPTSQGHKQRVIDLIKKNNSMPEADFIELLKKRNPNVILAPNGYKGWNTKSTFIDIELNESFQAVAANVMKGGRHPKRRGKSCEDTMMRKYGVKHNSHIPEVAHRMASSSSQKILKHHWKDNRIIFCQGKLEIAMVDYWNENKILYEWQIPFKMPDGYQYTVDAYLPEEDMYIEIKGYFRTSRNKEKWEWFHQTYPNSKLLFGEDVAKIIKVKYINVLWENKNGQEN